MNSVDVAVIGGGVVGLGVAYELATRTDHSVALFDKEGPGAGATGRSAGVICRHDQGPIYQRLSLIGHARMKHFASEFGLQFNSWGSLSVVSEPHPFPPESTTAPELLAAPSGLYVSEVLGRSELLSSFPWIAPEGVGGGVFEPNVGFINPYQLIDVYRRLLSDLHAVSVDYGNAVLGLRTDGDRVLEIETRRGVWRAGTVINASGAWANKVAGLAGARVPITPQRMNVAVATAYHDKAGRVPLHGAPGMQWEGDGVWCRGESGGGLLFGQHRDKTNPTYPPADPDFFDRLPDEGFAPSLMPHFVRHYRLPATRIVSGWTCVYDTSHDGHPIVGRDPAFANLIHAVGMNGHGMTIHPGIARCVASLVIDGSTSIDISDVLPTERDLDFSPLRPGRFDDGVALALRGESGGHATSSST